MQPATKLHIFSLFAALLLPVLLFAQPNPTIRAFKAEKLFIDGRQLFDAGDFAGAIDLFNQVVELDPDHQMVYELRGEAFFALGDFRNAIEDYTLAARQHPDNAEIRNSMGVAAANLNLYDAAYSYFYEALQIDPNHATARDNLAMAEKRRQNNTGNTNGGTWSTNTGNNTNWNNNTGNGNNTNWNNNTGNGNNTNWNNNTGNNTGWNNNANPNPQPQPNTPQPKLPKTYNTSSIVIGRQSDPYLRIEQILITQTGTQVTFSVEGIGTKPYPIQLDKVGGPHALYLADRSMRKIYRLKNIRSLQGWPDKPYTLRPAEKKIFVAEFEKLDDNVRFFHILEGTSEQQGTWEFWDVELKD